MVGAKRPGIFPLRVNDPVCFANCNPAAFTHRNARPLIRFVEPWNDAGRFRMMTGGCLIVVGQRAVKRILARGEFDRNVILAPRRVRIVEATVTSRPIFIPGTRAIRYRIVCGRCFTNPKNRGHNIALPRITFAGGRRRRLQMPRRKRD